MMFSPVYSARWARIRRGFTLIELLVVIVIIAVLASLLAPVFISAQEKAAQATCLSNVRQIATTAIMYAHDNNTLFPTGDVAWIALNLPAGVRKCPTANPKIWPNNTYGFNSCLGGVGIGAMNRPMSTIVVADGGNAAGLLVQATDVEMRHQGKFIASFLDGHAAMVANVGPDANYYCVDLSAQLWTNTWTPWNASAPTINATSTQLPYQLQGSNAYVAPAHSITGNVNPRQWKGTLLDFDPTTSGVQGLPATASGSLVITGTTWPVGSQSQPGSLIIFSGDTTIQSTTTTGPTDWVGGWHEESQGYAGSWWAYATINKTADSSTTDPFATFPCATSPAYNFEVSIPFGTYYSGTKGMGTCGVGQIGSAGQTLSYFTTHANIPNGVNSLYVGVGNNAQYTNIGIYYTKP